MNILPCPGSVQAPHNSNKEADSDLKTRTLSRAGCLTGGVNTRSAVQVIQREEGEGGARGQVSSCFLAAGTPTWAASTGLS